MHKLEKIRISLPGFAIVGEIDDTQITDASHSARVSVEGDKALVQKRDTRAGTSIAQLPLKPIGGRSQLPVIAGRDKATLGEDDVVAADHGWEYGPRYTIGRSEHSLLRHQPNAISSCDLAKRRGVSDVIGIGPSSEIVARRGTEISKGIVRTVVDNRGDAADVWLRNLLPRLSIIGRYQKMVVTVRNEAPTCPDEDLPEIHGPDGLVLPNETIV